MDQRECGEALSKHANIEPLITITVWNELEKENKEFFSSYHLKSKNEYRSQAAAQQMLEEAAAKGLDQDPRSDLAPVFYQLQKEGAYQCTASHSKPTDDSTINGHICSV